MGKGGRGKGRGGEGRLRRGCWGMDAPACRIIYLTICSNLAMSCTSLIKNLINDGENG